MAKSEFTFHKRFDEIQRNYEAKAISIATALEIGRRKASQEIPEKLIIKSSEQAYKILLPHLSDLRTEEFWVIFLNQKNQLIKKLKFQKAEFLQLM